MGYVQIDDLDCPNCNQITMGQLNMKTAKYECFKCGKVVK